MSAKNGITRQVHRALEIEPRINLHRTPIAIGTLDGAVVLEGEVDSVAAKKLALELATAVEGIRGVIDRLRVAPSERRGDGAIRDTLCNFMLAEPELRNCAVSAGIKGHSRKLREVPEASGDAIDVAVADGVITLKGTVISLSHKRIAGVLAWWTPGCRDVINALDVQPGE